MNRERIGNHLVKCNNCNTIYPDADEHACKPKDYVENPLEGREPHYEDSMYMIVFAVIGAALVGIIGFAYLVVQRIG